MSFLRKTVCIVIGVTVLLVLDHWLTTGFGPYKPPINEYALRVLILIGINITLAVSLNLINGQTGQFSIGHAGFMAVGGYAAGLATCSIFYLMYGADAPRVVNEGVGQA